MTTAPAPPTPRPASGRQRRAPTRVLFYVVCTLLVVLFVFPLLWALLNSLKTPQESMTSPPTLWPSEFTFNGYSELLKSNLGVGQSVINSLAVAAMTIVGAVTLSLLGGYGFARFRFPGRDLAFVAILLSLMIPFQSILTPLFLILKTFHLNNTLLGLALVYITFQLPFATFLMRNSFEGVPRAIEEAALIDGAGPATLLIRVMLPMVLPGVITVGLFAFFNSWNEFIAALIFQSDVEHYTLPVMLLSATSGAYGTINWNTIQAGMVISMLPCAVLFLLLQRYYMSGLTAGAVK